MKSSAIFSRVQANCINLLEHNVIERYLYSLFLIIDAFIKSIYPLAIIYFDDPKETINKYQNEFSNLSYSTIAITIFLVINISLLSTRVLSRNHIKWGTVLSLIDKFLMTSLTLINTFLMVPLKVVLFATMKTASQESFKQDNGILSAVLVVIDIIILVSLYIFTQHFYFCFFPNKKLPWSKPTMRSEIFKFLMNSLYAIIYIFKEENDVVRISMMCIITLFSFSMTAYSFFTVPYYDTLVDQTNCTTHLLISFVYFISTLKMIFPPQQQKISQLIIFSISLIITAAFGLKARIEFIKIKISSNTKQRPFNYSLFLINLVRLHSNSKNSTFIYEMEKWFLAHKEQCDNRKCECLKFQFNKEGAPHIVQTSHQQKKYELSNNQYTLETYDINTVDMTQIHLTNKKEGNQKNNQYSALNQNYFMAQLLISEDTNYTENEYELKLKKKITKLVLNLNNNEIEEFTKSNPELRLLNICVEIFTQAESYKAFFQILQLQSRVRKQPFKEHYTIKQLKKHIIQNISQKERQKKDQEKIFLNNQLKFEKQFQKFILDIKKTTDLIEDLWVQTVSKNFNILNIFTSLEQISKSYITLWKKFDQTQDKYMNAELLITFARFCDLVMCFEIEAENYYLKGTALQNSIKLQQQKGIVELESKIKSQEMLLNVQVTHKQIDRIVFANQKFLKFSKYRLEDIPTVKHILPSIIANMHDEMVTRFLSNKNKNNHKLAVSSWLKVKEGFVVPVTVLSFPFVDIKHDLRFIALIRPRSEITVEEVKLNLSSVFTFIVNEFGKIDCVSRECAEVYQINRQILDRGFHMQQLFKNFDYEKISEIQQDKEFDMNKDQLRDLQNELDIDLHQSINQLEIEHQVEVIGPTNNEIFSSLCGLTTTQQQHNISRRLTVIKDRSHLSHFKLYTRAISLGQTDGVIYEITAIPMATMLDMFGSAFSIQQQSNHCIFPSKNEQALKVIKSSQNDNNPEQQFDLQSLNNQQQEVFESPNRFDGGSQSSITSSEQSNKSKFLDKIRDIKDVTKLGSKPLIITRLSRWINGFFFILMITSVVLFIVNIDDKVNFKNGIVAVEDAFKIQFYVANIRLRFFYLFGGSNQDQFKTQDQFDKDIYQLQQQLLGQFIEEFRNNINMLTYAVQSLKHELQEQFTDPVMKVSEITTSGQIQSLAVSFQTASQILIQKADQYKNSSISQLGIKRSIFGLNFTYTQPKYSLSSDEINSYFIIQNTAYSIKSQADSIQNAFSEEVINFGNQTIQNILIFTLVCVAIVLISSVFLLPMLFRIDNNLGQSIKSWTMVKNEQKIYQIERIRNFKENLQSNDQEARMIPKEKKTFEDKLQAQTKHKHKTINRKKFEKDDFLEENDEHEEEEKIEEDFNDIKPNNSQKKQSKDNVYTISKQTTSVGKQKKNKQQNINKKSKQNEKGNDSDDSEMSQEKGKIGKNYEIKDQVDHITNQEQLISLVAYIFKRKVKIALLVTMFSLSLSSLYIGSLLVAQNIYNEALFDFGLLTKLSDRAPCIARNFFFLLYSIQLNTTLYNGNEETVSYSLNQCMQTEAYMRDIEKESSSQYSKISSILSYVDSSGSNFCDYYFTTRHFEGKTISESERNECKNYDNSTFSKGLKVNIDRIYSHLQLKNIRYQNSKNRTLSFLQNEFYDEQTQKLNMLYIRYICPVLDQIQRYTNKSLYDVLSSNFDSLVIMFSIFFMFIIVTWVISIKILVEKMSHTVERSKISIKLIPAEVLLEIKDILRDRSNL